MTDFARTVDLLERGGVPMRSVDLSTIQWWLQKGYSPERIATEIFSVDLPTSGVRH